MGDRSYFDKLLAGVEDEISEEDLRRIEYEVTQRVQSQEAVHDGACKGKSDSKASVPRNPVSGPCGMEERSHAGGVCDVALPPPKIKKQHETKHDLHGSKEDALDGNVVEDANHYIDQETTEPQLTLNFWASLKTVIKPKAADVMPGSGAKGASFLMAMLVSQNEICRDLEEAACDLRMFVGHVSHDPTAGPHPTSCDVLEEEGSVGRKLCSKAFKVILRRIESVMHRVESHLVAFGEVQDGATFGFGTAVESFLLAVVDFTVTTMDQASFVLFRDFLLVVPLLSEGPLVRLFDCSSQVGRISTYLSRVIRDGLFNGLGAVTTLLDLMSLLVRYAGVRCVISQPACLLGALVEAVSGMSSDRLHIYDACSIYMKLSLCVDDVIKKIDEQGPVDVSSTAPYTSCTCMWKYIESYLNLSHAVVNTLCVSRHKHKIQEKELLTETVLVFFSHFLALGKLVTGDKYFNSHVLAKCMYVVYTGASVVGNHRPMTIEQKQTINNLFTVLSTTSSTQSKG